MQMDLFNTEVTETKAAFEPSAAGRDYAERQQEKADYYAEKAQKTAKSAEATLESVRKERGMIPLGQPILVGHHSERGHRNHLARMDNRQRRGWEESQEAERIAEKGERIEKNIETDRVISSDDPDAIPKLKQKLIRLEVERTKYKEYNKTARKEGTDQLPRYVLRNLAGNVRSVKVRIANLEAKANLDMSEQEINGIRIEKDADENRVRLHFPGKPESDVRALLKRHGFRCSPRNNYAWQRQLNGAGLFAVDQVLPQINGLELANLSE